MRKRLFVLSILSFIGSVAYGDEKTPDNLKGGFYKNQNGKGCHLFIKKYSDLADYGSGKVEVVALCRDGWDTNIQGIVFDCNIFLSSDKSRCSQSDNIHKRTIQINSDSSFTFEEKSQEFPDMDKGPSTFAFASPPDVMPFETAPTEMDASCDNPMAHFVEGYYRRGNSDGCLTLITREHVEGTAKCAGRINFSNLCAFSSTKTTESFSCNSSGQNCKTEGGYANPKLTMKKTIEFLPDSKSLVLRSKPDLKKIQELKYDEKFHQPSNVILELDLPLNY